MNKLCRLSLTLTLLMSLVGCSSIHGTLGSDKAVSDLRADVEAPVELAAGESPFCAKPEPMPERPKPQVYTPPAPYSARLYFLLDQTVFTPESERESAEVYQEVVKRNAKEVIIVGHTDTKASSAYNEGLSLRRANRVKQDLIDAGVSPDVIKISADGEYNLLVVTPDETVEVRNRRVEINAR